MTNSEPLAFPASSPHCVTGQQRPQLWVSRTRDDVAQLCHSPAQHNESPFTGKPGGWGAFYPKLLLTSPPSMSMAAPKEDTVGTIGCFLTVSVLMLMSNVHTSKRTEMPADVFQQHQSSVTSHIPVMSYSHLSEMTPFKVSCLVRTDLATTNCTESWLALANDLSQQMTKENEKSVR